MESQRGHRVGRGPYLFWIGKFRFRFKCLGRRIDVWYEIFSMVLFGLLVSIYVLLRSDFEVEI